ncbi:MAG: DegT/DnrJ/EryC1/StrS family aminotransferase [Bacteroidota bacterium]
MIQRFIQEVREYYQRPTKAIYLIETTLFGNEYQFVKECLDSGVVSTIGKEVERLEQAAIQQTGAKYAVATSSGTAALHLGLLALGVQSNDWVLTTPFSFVATANAIAHAGASPLFLDIDRNTLGLSPDSLEQFLGEEVHIDNDGLSIHRLSQRRIAACLPVHVFGHPAHLPEIVSLCNQYNIPVLEDAAEGLGSTRDGRSVGTIGKAGVLSFNGNKIITTGGGGMLLTSDQDVYQFVCSRASQRPEDGLVGDSAVSKSLGYGAITYSPKPDIPRNNPIASALNYKRSENNETARTSQARNPKLRSLISSSISYNYQMPALNAALGLAQWEYLEKRIQQKRTLAHWYQLLFAQSEIKVLDEPADVYSNYWLNALLFPERGSRDQFVQEARKAGIEARPAWTLLSRYPAFYQPYSMPLPNAQWAESCLANVPSTILAHA